MQSKPKDSSWARRKVRSERVLPVTNHCQKVNYVSYPWGDYDERNRSDDAIMVLKRKTSDVKSEIFKLTQGYDSFDAKLKKFDLKEYVG